ncbi:hypothetical protein WQQ_41020 [Hydrocarboniphaga effusa AP103]|uniref:YetF C-terminal domain-containing protein n=2 Tax=Nevskiaceae TaxID=568386 RepID=I7Z7S4_9GAMM|nr:hypothetical protein WQQ_41020 [Hydrocarboniphaga effusa AP103]
MGIGSKQAMIEKIISVDWQTLMIPDSSVAEMVLRGTLTYWFLFLILRLFRRPTGQLGIADVLLITILADASQNAMGGTYESIASGFVLIATIVFWDRLIDHLAYRYHWFTPVAQPPPVVLIRNGHVQQDSLRRQKISDEELLSHLREQGIEDPSEARLCLLESDGRISVLKH